MVSKFIRAFKHELAAVWKLAPALVVVLCFILAGVITQQGVGIYKSQSSKFQKFIQIQKNKVATSSKYSEYMKDGFSTIFIQSPLGVLEQSSLISDDSISRVDSIAALKLANNIKGKSARYNTSILPLDFSGVILIFMSLFAAFYGYNTIKSKDQFRFFNTVCPNITFYIISARILLLALWVVLNFALVLALYAANGISIGSAELSVLMAVVLSAIINIVFFFLLGFLIRTFWTKSNAYLIIFGAWIFFIVFIPFIIQHVTESRLPDALMDYQSEINQLKIIKEFDARALKRNSDLSNEKLGLVKEILQEYVDNDYKKVEQQETLLKKQFTDYFLLNSRLNIFFPSSFCKSTIVEASSKGYKNYLRFYDNSQKLKYDFMRFIFRELLKPRPRKVVDFATRNQHVFYAVATLPDYYGWGVLINMCYLLALGVAVFRRTNAYLRQTEKSPYDLTSAENLNLKEPRIVAIYTLPYMKLAEKFLAVLNGETHPNIRNFKITIGGKEHPNAGGYGDYCFIPHPDELPPDETPESMLKAVAGAPKLDASIINAIKTGEDAIPLKKSFGQMTLLEKAEFLRRLIPALKTRLILVDRIGDDLPLSFLLRLNKTFVSLMANKMRVIYLTKQPATQMDGFQDIPMNTFREIPCWSSLWENQRRNEVFMETLNQK